MYFPMGGRNCSMTTVETGNALVFERMTARIATAVVPEIYVRSLAQNSRQCMKLTIYARPLASLALGRFPDSLCEGSAKEQGI